MKIKYLLLLLLFIVASCSAQEVKLVNYEIKLKTLLENESLQNRQLTMLIDKSDYTLTIKIDSQIIKSYPVVFGGNPVDDKLMQGDKCTPEGTFTMISKYPHKSWSRFIWINYPNDESWAKHRKAKSEGKIPGNAKIGGEIGIHGVPDNMDNLIDLRYNWTLGCISLKNKDINEIYPYFEKTTQIIIQK